MYPASYPLCWTAQVNIDLHLVPVQVTGDDVRHHTSEGGREGRICHLSSPSRPPWGTEMMRPPSPQHQLLTAGHHQPQLQSGRVEHQPSVLGVCVGKNHCLLCLSDCLHWTELHSPESRGKFPTDLLPTTWERVESFFKEEENMNKNKIPSEEWSQQRI